MLVKMPGARDYIETGRVSRIGLDDSYVKVMDGPDKMLSRNFNSPEEANAWADEVAKIVNEANAPKTPSVDQPPPPSFADWQPTEEQIKEAGRALESLPPAALIDPLCVHQMRTSLRIWQRIYAAQAKLHCKDQMEFDRNYGDYQ